MGNLKVDDITLDGSDTAAIKLDTATSKNYLTRKNKIGFAAGGFGQNLIIGMVNSYLLYFFTDVFVIGLAATTIINIGARIFDAFNDPIMGTIVDKTNTKMGKLRPYLAATPIPLIALTALVFYAPNFSPAGKIAWAATTYILWGIVYTVCDIPFWGLPSVMTPNPDERVKFITFSRLFHAIGGTLPMLLIPLFELKFGKGTKDTFLYAALFSAIVGGFFFSFAFFGSTERVVKADKSPTMSECFKHLFKNKPLLIVVLANVVGFTRAIALAAGMYMTNYLVTGLPGYLSAATANTLLVAGWGIAGFAGMLFTPLFYKKMGYKKIYSVCCAIAIAACILLVAFGTLAKYNFFLFFSLFFLMGMPYGIICNINYALIAESVDYTEWKSGVRTEGVSISMQTLMNKVMTALQMGLIPIALILIKYQAPKNPGESIIQTESTRLGLFFVVTIAPLIGWVLNLIVINLYPISDSMRKQMYEELHERRKAHETKLDLEETLSDYSLDDEQEVNLDGSKRLAIDSIDDDIEE